MFRFLNVKMKRFDTNSVAKTHVEKALKISICCITIILQILIFNSCSKPSPKYFVDNRNGTISDLRTGLMWSKTDNGFDINWDDAKEYCEKLELAEFNDWRLPTISELKTLIDKQQFSIASNKQGEIKALPINIAPIFSLGSFIFWSSELEDSNGEVEIEGSTGKAYIQMVMDDFSSYADSKGQVLYHRVIAVRFNLSK
jgi:hypothetical protein